MTSMYDKYSAFLTSWLCGLGPVALSVCLCLGFRVYEMDMDVIYNTGLLGKWTNVYETLGTVSSAQQALCPLWSLTNYKRVCSFSWGGV